MADLGSLLGSMIATGMGGRRSDMGRRSTPRASSGYTAGQAATIAGLGYLAWQAFQQFQKSAGTSSTSGTSSPTETGTSSGGSLGDSITKILRAPTAPTPPPAPLPDAKALLLIRAMVAAANADGEISTDERQRITSTLTSAGAGQEERATLERELQQPLSIDQIVKAIPDEETRDQVYMASYVAVDPSRRAERAYLDFLASRLRIEPDRMQALETSV
jgi:uncharacterized membrane protein YebE (DUF533 family)